MLLNKNIIINNLLYFLSFLLFFILSRQVPFDSLSFLMNFALFAIVLLRLNKVIYSMNKNRDLLVLFIVTVAYLVFNFFYSLLLGNDVSNILRFFLIILFLLISYFIVLPVKIIKIFIYLYSIHALLIIVFSLLLSLYFSNSDYLPIRAFIREKEWGDIFTYNGWFYRVQIKGNALLPVAFFTTFFYNFNYKKTIRLILLIGCVIAGNFAFLIAIFLFFLFFYLKKNNLKKNLKRVSLILLFSGIFSLPFYNYFIKDTIELKSEGSLPLRNEQLNLLINDMSESYYYIFGKGLGNTINKSTPYRDYRDDIYFELQSVYFLNQIGLIGMLLFVIYNCYLTIRLFNRGLILLYFCFLFYALTNPYIFDTNHFAVILIINSLQYNET